MAMVSARSSGVMCTRACWIGAAGWGRCGLVSSRSRARSRERPGSSEGFGVMGAILPYQARCLVENGRHDRLGEQARADRGGRAIVTSSLGVLAGRRRDENPPWTFPGEKIEAGESPEDAAVREALEEPGCGSGPPG